MKFIVDRRLWFRGEGYEASRLVRADGRMCCLGMLGVACGGKWTEASLEETDSLSDAEAARPASLTGLVGQRYPHASQQFWPFELFTYADHVEQTEGGSRFGRAPKYTHIADINDDKRLSDADRERLLTEKFSEVGIEVEFVQ